MVYFSHKGGCGVHEHMHIEAFKEELACAIDKLPWAITNTILFKTGMPLRI